MIVHFIKINPCGNTTVLVTTPIESRQYATLSSVLLKSEWCFAEQVGFIKPSTLHTLPSLSMMGGEFCGNATRATAAYVAHSQTNGAAFPKDGLLVKVICSGASAPISCTVTHEENTPSNIYEVSACMPSPMPILIKGLPIKHQSLETYNNDSALFYNEFAALLPALAKIYDCGGLIHFVIPTDSSSLTDAEHFYESIKPYITALAVPAVGVLFYNTQKSTLIPVVHVSATNTTYWEQSCGSGTIAIGAFVNENKDLSTIGNSGSGTPPLTPITINVLPLRQPGGTLTVRTDILPDNEKIYHLSGPVEITLEGDAFVNL